jgi:hypothetical protein
VSAGPDAAAGAQLCVADTKLAEAAHAEQPGEPPTKL